MIAFRNRLKLSKLSEFRSYLAVRHGETVQVCRT